MLRRFWDRLPFVARLLVTASVALLVAGVSMLYVSARTEGMEADRGLQVQLENELSTLPAALSEIVVIGDFSTLQQTLDRYVQRPNITRVDFLDTSGVALTSHDASEDIQAPDWFVHWVGLTRHSGSVQVTVGGRSYGQLSLLLTPEEPINRTWRHLKRHLMVLLLAVGMDFIGIWLVLRGGLRPLRALETGSRALEKGDFSVRIPLHGSPELRHSIAAFNRMAESLQKFMDERRQTEEALRRERDFIHAVLDTAGSIIMVIDRKGCIVRLNRTAEEFTGYAFDEVKDQPFFWEKFLLPEQTSDVRHVFEGVREGNIMPRYENHWLRWDGEKRLFDWSNTLLCDPNGQMEYLVTVGTDITERKASEDALKRLNETLEQRVGEEVTKNREKDHILIQQSRLAALGEMIGNIAHQWRQPINALNLVLANIKDAQEFGDLTPEVLERQIKQGNQLISRMSVTIDDFRNFFRPNKEPVLFDLRRSVEDVKGILGASLANNNIHLEEDLDGESLAYGYPNEFAQVLLNLMNNAKEAILERNVRGGVIRILMRHENGRAVLRVADNGGGIPDDVLPKVFDPYFTTKEKGTGVGLYMSRMILENMGGEVAARNTDGGAELVVSLPLAKTATSDNP